MIGEECPPSSNGGAVTLSMTDVNPHFVCVLCFGYFVDATTIAECLHTFCRSCIVSFLSNNHHCPHCDALLSRTRPLSSLRPDRVMQALVYKTVPGLFQTEMRRRIQFYQENPHPDFVADLEGVQNYVFNPDDSISLSIRYYSLKEGEESSPSDFSGGLTSPQDLKTPPSNTLDEDETGIPDIRTIRYFRCPATVPVSVLKSLIKTKYRIPDFLRVELLYGEECLLDSWTLMEVAYIFQWNRESPMELTFQVLITRKVKRKRFRLVRKVRKYTKASSHFPRSSSLDRTAITQEDPNRSDEPPQKKTKVDASPTLSATDEQHHPRPLTPPETPDDAQDIGSDTDTLLNNKSTSFKIKREVCFSPQRSLPVSKQVPESNNAYFKETKRSYLKKKKNAEKDYHLSSSKKSPHNTNTKFDSTCSETVTRYSEDDVHLQNEEPSAYDGSCDFEGDQDSEASLEVDTSHETETEADNDADISADSDVFKDSRDGNTFDEEEEEDDEQGDSAIDVNEHSASEVMDSDDKDTDFNLSSESLDVDNNHKIDKSADRINRDSVALDLSSHARSVRAKRKDQSDSSTPPSPIGDSERDLAAQALMASSLNGNPINMTEKLKEFLPIGQSLLARGAMAPRPPLPMDWVRPPPLVPPGGVPHAAAFRDLFTLSHAAVQLQIAMAHAQAQAQAQAQTQKAQVQTNVLKNLKSSESLSFVNGSGDTLTISPIVGTQGEQKPKTSTKVSKTKLQFSCLNGKTKSQINSRKNDTTVPVKNKIPVNGQSQSKQHSLPSKNVNGNMKSSHLSGNHPHSSKNLLSPTLKIPRVQLTSNQNGNSKPDKHKEKKEHEKEVERTGDPVFKITNQKLIEFVRQQHLNNKLKQNSNNNNNNTLKSTDNNNDSSCQKSSTTATNNSTFPQNSSSKPLVKPLTNCSSPQNTLSKLPAMKQQLAAVSSPNTQNSGSKLNTLSSQKDNSSNNISNRNKVNSVISSPHTSSAKLPTVPATSNTSSSIQLNGSKSLVSSSTTTTLSSSLYHSVPLNSSAGTMVAATSQANNSRMIASCTASAFSTKSITSISPTTTPSANSIRTTNTSVRQIPNPSRLHQQSENRLSAGMGRLSALPKKGLLSGSQTQGLSRIESLTRSLHEKVAASAAAIAASGGVLNTAAR